MSVLSSLPQTQAHITPDDSIDPSLRSPPRILAPTPVRRSTLPPTPQSPQPQHLASSSSSSFKSPKPPSRPPSRTERRYKCTHPGCDKAYFKPSRLTEHELSHTGERPHKCPECDQSYLRASHLHAHMRTHLPTDAKPFSCEREGCGKTFWTATHLKRHEEMHDRAEEYPCEACGQIFSKAHLLREHVALAHMPEGTKPFPCTHEGCGASFTFKAKLKAHEKTHDPTRYTCSHPSHGAEFPSFPVWSALQTHIHEAHPATCPHEECNGRTFKSTHHLKMHLKVHAEQEADRAALAEIPAPAVAPIIADGLSRRAKRRRQSEAAEGGKSPKLRRVESGEAGKDWGCDHDGCEKRFKTRFAMESHRRAIHLKERKHVCPTEGCAKAFPHKATLLRHIETHSRPSTPAAGAPGAGRTPSEGQALTGHVRELRRFGCPAYALEAFLAGSEIPPMFGFGHITSTSQESRLPDLQAAMGSEGDIPIPTPETNVIVKQEIDDDHPAQRNMDTAVPAPGVNVDDYRQIPEFAIDPSLESDPHTLHDRCWMRFWRVYDVRRHLKAEHGVELQDMEVRRLLLSTGQTGE